MSINFLFQQNWEIQFHHWMHNFTFTKKFVLWFKDNSFKSRCFKMCISKYISCVQIWILEISCYLNPSYKTANYYNLESICTFLLVSSISYLYVINCCVLFLVEKPHRPLPSIVVCIFLFPLFNGNSTSK